jgi:hypothetical protein
MVDAIKSHLRFSLATVTKIRQLRMGLAVIFVFTMFALLCFTAVTRQSENKNEQAGEASPGKIMTLSRAVSYLMRKLT